MIDDEGLTEAREALERVRAREPLRRRLRAESKRLKAEMDVLLRTAATLREKRENAGK